jgi:ABC-type Fe3+/spermidine/putrescine transport system ATPase subunit
MGLVNLLPGTVAAVSGLSCRIRLGAAFEIETALKSSATAGEEVEVAIRPESIDLEPAAAASHGVRARVTDRTFLGNTVEYQVALDGLPPIRVQAHPRHRFATGDEVSLRVDQQELSVFQKSARNGAADVSKEAGAMA